MYRGPQLLLLALAPLILLASGCSILLPEVSHQPVVHNPFPQLSSVAVVPFFNQSAEATVDGREFALAYYAELQSIPGFEVVPVPAVEAAIRQYGITFDPPEQAIDQARWLAKKLGVDAVVIGTVTDFNPYYPPRCGMRVEWYAANEGFHEIPAGYGLPWGTAQEEYIPDRVVFEAEMALAREQMKTQSPTVAPKGSPAVRSVDELLEPMREPAPLQATPPGSDPFEEIPTPEASQEQGKVESIPPPPAAANPLRDEPLRQASFEAPIDETGRMTDPNAAAGAFAANGMLPPDWPDARGFSPPGPSCVRPTATPNEGPVMTHTRVYRGDDPDFTAALASYVEFRDDARFGGWQSYLSRSEDFIRFSCHLHLVEMLSSRGGADETRVVRRWSEGR